MENCYVASSDPPSLCDAARPLMRRSQAAQRSQEAESDRVGAAWWLRNLMTHEMPFRRSRRAHAHVMPTILIVGPGE